MENSNQLKENELYHWGVRGMRWGIRRYQNPDGSLTQAGKRKRLAEQTDSKVKKIESQTEAKIKKMKEASKVNKKVAKAEEKAKAKIEKAEKKYGLKKDEGDSKKEKPKSIKDMTNEEIQSKIERVRLENTLNSLTPQKESKGKAFIKSAMNDVVAPAAKNVGRSYLEKVMKDKLGLDKKDTLDALDKEVKKLQLQETLSKLKDKELSEKIRRNEKARLDKDFKDMTKAEDKFARMERENKNYRTWAANQKFREQFYKDMESKGYTDVGKEHVDDIIDVPSRVVNRKRKG